MFKQWQYENTTMKKKTNIVAIQNKYELMNNLSRNTYKYRYH